MATKRAVGRLGAGLAVCAAIGLAGCGSSDSSGGTGTGSSGASGSSGVAAAQAEVDRFRQAPKFEAPGEPIDARKIAAGKTLESIPASSSIDFVQTLQKGVRSLAGEVGLKFLDWPNQGTPVQWTQGMDAGVDRKVSAINLMAGINPSSLGPQIAKAKAAGIPVIASHLYDVAESPAEGTQAVSAPYEQAGRLLADWVVAKTKADAHVLVVKIDEVPSTKPMMKGINDVFSERCGSGCDVKTINVAIADVATRIQPQVQAALTRDPRLDYVIALYDSAEAPFVVSAIKQSGRSGKTKVVTFNGTPSVLKLVKAGDVEMDIGENLDWISYAVLDQALRIIGGKEPVKDPKLPIRLWDSSNIGEAGSPPSTSEGYGSAYVQGYRDLWGLGK
jgi:ribose transport system substrate-binding protein